jgi:hypothetical protein
MTKTHDTPKPRSSKSRHLDELLDEGLKETFPASDPVAISLEEPSGKNSQKARTAGQQTSPPQRQE